MQESRHLRELDISWNLLKPQSYINLINSLGENRMLLSLNLSFNSIFESKEIFPEQPAQGSPTQLMGTSRKVNNVMSNALALISSSR